MRRRQKFKPRVDVIKKSYPSPNHAPRKMKIQFLVIHCTATASTQAALDILTTPEPPSTNPVSAHYVIDDATPTEYDLVPENLVAWHAGISSWQGVSGLNGPSVGVEFQNPTEDKV